jgi:hypothetical protein
MSVGCCLEVGAAAGHREDAGQWKTWNPTNMMAFWS